MPSKNVIQCSKVIAAKGYKIAFAESATAGRMCSEFALTPNSGDILMGGISSYQAYIKENILGVPHKLIEEYTPESAEVTKSLAEHSAKMFKSDITVAVTGLTTPGGSETQEKPVGTMFFYIIMPKTFIEQSAVLTGSPEEIVLKAIDKAAFLILQELQKY